MPFFFESIRREIGFVVTRADDFSMPVLVPFGVTNFLVSTTSLVVFEFTGPVSIAKFVEGVVTTFHVVLLEQFFEGP